MKISEYSFLHRISVPLFEGEKNTVFFIVVQGKTTKRETVSDMEICVFFFKFWYKLW